MEKINMSKLTKLEALKLAELYKKMVPIHNNLSTNADSIADTVYQQFEFKAVEEDDQNTLDVSMKHFQMLHEGFEDCFELVVLLVDHFDV